MQISTVPIAISLRGRLPISNLDDRFMGAFCGSIRSDQRLPGVRRTDEARETTYAMTVWECPVRDEDRVRLGGSLLRKFPRLNPRDVALNCELTATPLNYRFASRSTELNIRSISPSEIHRFEATTVESVSSWRFCTVSGFY